jgi:formate transporter
LYSSLVFFNGVNSFWIKEISMNDVRIDALLPQEMANRAESLGVRKAEMPFLKMLMLSVLAGAFISLGASFATTVSTRAIVVMAADGTVVSNAALPYGVTRLLAGFAFSLGLILVGVGGGRIVHRQ